MDLSSPQNPDEAMRSSNVSGLNGLPYCDEAYFDFVVAERPKYIPGSGPPLAPISVLLPHDKDGYIKEKSFIAKELKYLVGYEDNPNLNVTVSPDKILDWVSRRTLETWENEEYQRIEKEKEDALLPGLQKREAANRKRMEKRSREGVPKVDGRRRKRKATESDPQKSFGTPRKRGRRGKPLGGWPSKSPIVPPLNVPSTAPGRKSDHNIPSIHNTPRRLSQHTHQPSLSTPQRLGEVTILNSEEESDDHSVIQPALEAQLNECGTQSATSSRSTSLDPLSQSLDSGETSITTNRRSIIGGRSAVAATSSREAFEIHNTIEKFKSHQTHQSPDNSVILDRSSFKKKRQQPALFLSPKLSLQTLSKSDQAPRSTRSASRQISVSPAFESVRRSERARSTPPPPPPPLYIKDDKEEEEEEEAFDDQEYEIEKILGDEIREINGKPVRCFLVRWVGYPDSDNTWEPIYNVGAGGIAEYRAAKIARGRGGDRQDDKRPAHGEEESLFVSPVRPTVIPVPGRVVDDDDDDDDDDDMGIHKMD